MFIFPPIHTLMHLYNIESFGVTFQAMKENCFKATFPAGSQRQPIIETHDAHAFVILLPDGTRLYERRFTHRSGEYWYSRISNVIWDIML
jgi:hypothetical protein